MSNPNIRKYGFKKGQSGNPSGRPPVPPEIKAIKELEKEEMTKLFSYLLRLKRDELKQYADNPNVPIKQIGISKAIVKWVNSGDFRYIQPYIAYIFGTPVAKHELTGQDGGIINIAFTNQDKVL